MQRGAWCIRLKEGTQVAYPAFTNPVGKPLGEYTRLQPDVWRFTRDFEHVRVSFDLEHRIGRLE